MHFYTLISPKFNRIASPDPASGSSSGEWSTKVSRSDCPSANDFGFHFTSSHIFPLYFCNIRGFRYSFQYVEQHPSSTNPYFLFLTETQCSVTTDSSPFAVPSYFLYRHFQSKAGSFAYVRNDITCFRANNLESSDYSNIWLRSPF